MMDSIAEKAPAADLQRTPRRKPVPADLAKTDRLPPHSAEAEQGVLGCVLLSPNECMGECIQKLKVGPEVFYDLRHQTIFTVLQPSARTMQSDVRLALTLTLSPRLSITHNFSRRIIILYLYLNGLCIL